eukprot:Pgem_evm1s32
MYTKALLFGLGLFSQTNAAYVPPFVITDNTHPSLTITGITLPLDYNGILNNHYLAFSPLIVTLPHRHCTPRDNMEPDRPVGYGQKIVDIWASTRGGIYYAHGEFEEHYDVPYSQCDTSFPHEDDNVHNPSYMTDSQAATSAWTHQLTYFGQQYKKGVHLDLHGHPNSPDEATRTNGGYYDIEFSLEAFLANTSWTTANKDAFRTKLCNKFKSEVTSWFDETGDFNHELAYVPTVACEVSELKLYTGLHTNGRNTLTMVASANGLLSAQISLSEDIRTLAQDAQNEFSVVLANFAHNILLNARNDNSDDPNRTPFFSDNSLFHKEYWN